MLDDQKQKRKERRKKKRRRRKNGGRKSENDIGELKGENNTRLEIRKRFPKTSE